MKLKLSAVILSIFLLPVTAFASVEAYNLADTRLGVFNKIKCSGIACSQSSGKLLMNASSNIAAEATNATLTLAADESDDNGDDWLLSSVASGNAFTISNDTSGTQAAKFSLSTAGVATFTAALTLSDAETVSNPSDDVVRVASNDAAIVLEAYTPGTSDADATLRLTADASADNGDEWDIVHDGATNSLLFQNDATGSQATKLTLSTGGALTVTGDIAGDGADQLYGFLQDQVTATATTITAAQCGKTFISAGAIEIELPEASTVLGCRLTFIAGTADDFHVDPDAADVILPITASGGTISPSAGDRVLLTDAGASLTIEAISATNWAAVAHNGAITDAN